MGLKNTSQKVKTDKILAVLFVIFTCVTTLLSCYMKNALIFSQSDIYNFFMYITKRVIASKHQNIHSTIDKTMITQFTLNLFMPEKATSETAIWHNLFVI